MKNKKIYDSLIMIVNKNSTKKENKINFLQTKNKIKKRRKIQQKIKSKISYYILIMQ